MKFNKEPSITAGPIRWAYSETISRNFHLAIIVEKHGTGISRTKWGV